MVSAKPAYNVLLNPGEIAKEASRLGGILQSTLLGERVEVVVDGRVGVTQIFEVVAQVRRKGYEVNISRGEECGNTGRLVFKQDNGAFILEYFRPLPKVVPDRGLLNAAWSAEELFYEKKFLGGSGGSNRRRGKRKKGNPNRAKKGRKGV